MDRPKFEIGQRQSGGPPYRLQLPVRLVYADGTAELRNVEVAVRPQSSTVLSAGKAVGRVDLAREHHNNSAQGILRASNRPCAHPQYLLALTGWIVEEGGKLTEALDQFMSAVQALVRERS